jgi:hypothetical protein
MGHVLYVPFEPLSRSKPSALRSKMENEDGTQETGTIRGHSYRLVPKTLQKYRIAVKYLEFRNKSFRIRLVQRLGYVVT